MDEYIANIIEERQRKHMLNSIYGLKTADCSSGVTAHAIRNELDRAVMKEQMANFQPFVVSKDWINGCWDGSLTRVTLGDTIQFNVDPKTISEENQMNKPTIIDLIYKYMRKAHCKKGDAIKRICKAFDYAEHDLAKDIARANDDSLPIDFLTSYWLDFYHDLDKMSVEKAEKRVYVARFNQHFIRISTNKFRIKDVIFNNPATIIFWEDGTKTVAKCKEGETYSPEIGIMVCYFKRIITAPFNCHESPNKALSLLSGIATYNTKGDK